MASWVAVALVSLGAGPIFPVSTASSDDASSLSVALLAVPIPGPSDVCEVMVVTEILGSDLLAGLEGRRLAGSIELGILDQNGRPVERLEQPFALDLIDVREDLLASGLRYFARFPEIAPGRYRVEARVALSENGANGTSSANLDVVAAPGPLLWPPLFSSANDRWLSYGQTVGAGATSDRPYPFERADGTQFVPAVRPRLAAGAEVRVELVAFRADDLALDISAALLETDGSPTSSPAVSSPVADALVNASAVPSAGTGSTARHWHVDLRTSELIEGRYVLRAQLRDDEIGDDISASTTLLVSSHPVDGAEPSASADAAAVDVAEEPLVIGDDTRLAVSRVLRTLAGGEIERAARGLEMMQATALDSETQRADTKEARRCRSALLEATREVAEVDAEAVLPIVLAQKLANERFATERQVWLAAQGTLTQQRLAQLYLEHLPLETRFLRGAELYAVIGDPHHALELDPDNELALLRLALDHEKSSAWEAARLRLDHLLRLRPGDEEVRLRLAMNQLRTGDTDAGRRHLREILDRSEVERPVAILAFQELAQVELELGYSRRAVSILEQGIDHFPDDQGLRLELAFLHEQLGRSRDADRLLNRIEAPAPPVLETPRSWYNHGPEDEIEAARSRLREQVGAGLPRLAAALAAREGVR